MEEFDVWYANYPHKVAKGAARKAFANARKRADLKTLVEGLERYVRTKPAHIAWCNPATWLNGERWDDQPNYGDNYGTTGNVIPAAERLIERIGLFDQPAPSELCGGAGTTVVRLLPKR